MADTLESLEIEVKHNSSGAEREIGKVTAAIKEMADKLEDALPKLKSYAETLAKVGGAIKKNTGSGASGNPLSQEMQDAIRNADRLQIAMHKVSDSAEKMEDAFKKGNADKAWKERERNLNANAQAEKISSKNQQNPLSAAKQISIATANEIDILLHKLASLREEMLKAFDAGDSDKAYALRHQIIQTEKAIEKATGAVGKYSKALSILQAVGNAASKTFGFITSVVKKVIGIFGKLLNAIKKVISSIVKLATSGLSNWFEKMRDNVKSILNPLNKVMSSLGRIAFYRLIRSAIKAVTDALKEGSDNAYFFAKNFGNATKYIADAMDSLKSAHFKMSNQLGAAWNTLLATITPIVIQIIRMVTKAAEAITQFFAVISGSGTYLKAKDYTHAWADETEKGAKAAKEWKNQLMGFDEINRLEEPSDTAGKTPDKYTDFENMFEEANVKSWIKDLVNMLKGGEFERVGKLLGDKFNSLVSGFDWKGWGAKIGKGIQGGIDFAYSFLKTADFRNVGKSLANFLDSLGDQIDFKKAGRLATRLKTAIWDILYGAFTNPGSMGKLARNISDFVLGALEELADWLDSLDPIAVANAIRDFFDNIKGEEIKNAFVRVVKTAWEKTVTLKEELFPDGLLPTITKNIVEFVKKIPWADIKKALLECYEQLKSTVKEVFDIIWPKDERDAFVENLKDKIQEVFQKAIKKIDLAVIHNILAYKLDEAIFGEDAAKKMWYNKGDFAGRELILGTEYGIMREKQALDDTVKGYVTDPVSEALYELEKTGRESGNALARAMAKGTSDSSRSIGSLKADISRDASNIKSNMSKVSGSAKDVTKEMQSMQSRGSGFMRNLASSANTYSRSIVSGLSNVIAKARDAFNSLSSLSSTKFSASVTPGKVKKYASGGFVEEGPFYMNHGEIAGKFSNGRTAIANSNMITDGIENATYRAMTEALSSQNQNRGNGTVVLNVNGREFMRAIYSDMKAVSKEKGVSLISNFA